MKTPMRKFYFSLITALLLGLLACNLPILPATASAPPNELPQAAEPSTAQIDGVSNPAQDFPADLIQPGDLVYQGAFRLPGGEDPPLTFAYGGNAMTYNPSDLARVAAGELEAWQPQPYAALDIDEHLYLNGPEWDEINNGWGDQRRYRVGAAAYDRENALFYVLDLFADGGKPVVHVWRVQP